MHLVRWGRLETDHPPAVRKLARANRRFLVRAVRYAAEVGVRQFIDLGTGFPTSPNVHEVAHTVHSGVRVVYVDHDPVVTTHNRALRATLPGVIAIEGDIRHPHGILADTDLLEVIDFTAPVAVLFVAVLHFVRPEDDPARIIAAFADRMAPGSYLTISHGVSDDTDDDALAKLTSAYRASGVAVTPRATAEVASWFGGFKLIRPGLTECGPLVPGPDLQAGTRSGDRRYRPPGRPSVSRCGGTPGQPIPRATAPSTDSVAMGGTATRPAHDVMELPEAELAGQLVQAGVKLAPRHVTAQLNLDTGARAFVRQRLLTDDSEPVELVSVWLPLDLAQGTGLTSPDLLDESLRQHLQARKKIRFDHAVEQITARHPSGEEAELLGIAADAPVLSVIVTAYDAAGSPIQVSDLVLPGQRHEIRDAYPFT